MLESMAGLSTGAAGERSTCNHSTYSRWMLTIIYNTVRKECQGNQAWQLSFLNKTHLYTVTLVGILTCPLFLSEVGTPYRRPGALVPRPVCPVVCWVTTASRNRNS